MGSVCYDSVGHELASKHDSSSYNRHSSEDRTGPVQPYFIKTHCQSDVGWPAARAASSLSYGGCQSRSAISAMSLG